MRHHNTVRKQKESEPSRTNSPGFEDKEGKDVFARIPSVFDIAGESKMTRNEAFKRLDKMREEG